MKIEHELKLLILVTELAKTYNNLDHSFVENLLAEDVVYESQNVIVPLKGKATVIDYLKKKFEKLRETPDAKLYAELGFLGNLGNAEIKTPFAHEGQPCIIMSQGNKNNKLAVVLVEQMNGKISRIDICTVAPYWSQAKGTDEYPE